MGKTKGPHPVWGSPLERFGKSLVGDALSHHGGSDLQEAGAVCTDHQVALGAGGVATSGLEMSQNSERLSWSFEEVDAKLKGIMEGIFHASYDASVAAGSEGNLMVGANCAGFLKVATAMMAQGITY